VIVADNVPEQALFRQNMKIWEMDELQKKKTISAYMASVRFMDQQVGRLLDALDRLGIREETIVVFVSDHGYNLGEHDCWSKQSLWEGSVRIPMIISHPGSTETHGTTCESIAELIDLYPTLTELCGLHTKQPAILQGKSLVGYLRGDDPPSDEALAYTVTHRGRAASIRTRQWRYTRWGELAEAGNEELYDHMKDPEEHSNLAHKQEMQETLVGLRKQFEQARNRARTDGIAENQARL
jgi:arylsulfatase A-like enzyme